MLPWYEKLMVGGAQVALIGLGITMLALPAWIVRKNRDDDDPRPVTMWDVVSTRVLGVCVIILGGYILYAVVTNMPMAEFSPV
jgi:hypothetical protein